MANKQKKTQKEMYTEIIDVLETLNPTEYKEYIDFLGGRIEQLNKKSSKGEGGMTDKQKENRALADEIYAYMEPNKEYSITDLMKEVPALQEVDPLTNQRTTALVKLLVDDGTVTRKEVKGRAKFVKVVEVEGE